MALSSSLGRCFSSILCSGWGMEGLGLVPARRRGCSGLESSWLPVQSLFLQLEIGEMLLEQHRRGFIPPPGYPSGPPPAAQHLLCSEGAANSIRLPTRAPVSLSHLRGEIGIKPDTAGMNSSLPSCESCGGWGEGSRGLEQQEFNEKLPSS